MVYKKLVKKDSPIPWFWILAACLFAMGRITSITDTDDLRISDIRQKPTNIS